MIWVAWRQFRTQALVTLGLLAAFAVLVLVTGLHLRDVYSSLGGTHCARTHRRLCSAERARQGPGGPARPRAARGPGAARDVLGRAAARARARERDLPPRLDAERHAPALAVGQGRARRASPRSASRPRELARQLVVRAARRRQHESLRPERVHRTRGRRDRLRGLRVRARRRGRRGDAPHAAGDGGDAASASSQSGSSSRSGSDRTSSRPRRSWFPQRWGKASGSPRAPRVSASLRRHPRSPTPGRPRQRFWIMPTMPSARRSCTICWFASARRLRRANCRASRVWRAAEPAVRCQRRAVASPAAARHLPAGKPLLAAAGARDRNLPARGAGADLCDGLARRAARGAAAGSRRAACADCRRVGPGPRAGLRHPSLSDD